MSCRHTDRVLEILVSGTPLEADQELRVHAETCPECRAELDAVRLLLDSFVAWPIDVLRPSASLWPRLEATITPARTEVGGSPPAWSEPEWLDVATGIACKILVTDGERGLVSMLVRLAPGATYPAHTHADLEELHLLAGQLWINDRDLRAGDFHLAHRGSADLRVMSETGCTCLLITSTHDELSRGREEA